MDLRKFVYSQTLQANPTQKTLYLLGRLQGQQNDEQAIIIITPKFPQLPSINYTKQNQQEQLPILPFTQIEKIFKNDIYSKFQVRFQNNFEIQSIFPITQKHKAKYRKKIKFIQKQTGQQYQQKQQKILAQQLSHIGWVQNILDGKAQQQRVLYNDADIMLLPDFKFHNLKEIENLHLLCIFKDLNLHSIRDLKGSHLELLQRVQKIVGQQLQKHFTLSNTHKVGIKNCRVYFHYPPTFYQLHLHIQSLQLNTNTCNVERCHQLTTVINNIHLKPDYYQQATLNCFKQQSINQAQSI